MKKFAVLTFLALTCVTSFGGLTEPESCVYAQKKHDDKPKKKDQPGPPVVKEKHEREKPPPPPNKPRKP